MNTNQLITIKQNAKSALTKSKNLLDITKKILEKKDLIENFEFKPFLMEKKCLNLLLSVIISPDGKYIVSADEETIKIWDIKSGECLNTLDKFSYVAESVRLLVAGKYIISASVHSFNNGKIKIWDIKTGECLNSLEIHLYSGESLAISPDRKYIVSGGNDGIKSGILIQESVLTF